MRDKSNWVICGGLAILLVGVSALALFSGVVRVPFSQMLQSGIIELRVARILLAIVAGAGLSIAGVVFQALFRNPLAEPYVLGVSSGAGLAAAAAIFLNLTILAAWTLPAMAFGGALGTILLVYGLARDRTGAAPVHTLLLSGVMISAVFSSGLMFMVSVSTTQNLHNVLWWLLGNLQIFDWALLRVTTVVVGLGLAITIVLSRDLNLMTLGEEPAAHLGLNVERTKMLFLLVASLMTGAVVAACGLIGFVGLIVPHSVRLAIGPDHRRLVPASALAGSTFMVLADSLARTVIAPVEIPIGVVTALLGGPFFVFILRRRKRRSWS